MQNGTLKTQNFLLKSGTISLRYGLVIILVWIGLLKFTAYEAESIYPLAQHSPLFSWMLSFLNQRTFSNLIGIIEVSAGILIALRSYVRRLSAIGSMISVLTFLVTLSFLVSTPGILQQGMSFPFISGMPGQFLIKDLVLLGASVWTAGEAMAASNVKRKR
ncbi:YkgB family protein [Pedobacter sp. V48]|uniref:YkgB family protein n=1 Tax=Pedobacter sp. V48 TaxID=509635 RepID=UPI0003E5465E|nr:DUF417 family protein [Pedobacter sp. V48]ETZ19556.1 hypothetical protein N824_12505 [Pedobacter sp. V48]